MPGNPHPERLGSKLEAVVTLTADTALEQLPAGAVFDHETEASIDIILSIAEYFGGARIELGSDDGRMTAELELDVNFGK